LSPAFYEMLLRLRYFFLRSHANPPKPKPSSVRVPGSGITAGVAVKTRAGSLLRRPIVVPAVALVGESHAGRRVKKLLNRKSRVPKVVMNQSPFKANVQVPGAPTLTLAKPSARPSPPPIVVGSMLLEMVVIASKGSTPLAKLSLARNVPLVN